MYLTPALWWSAKRSFPSIPFFPFIPVWLNELTTIWIPTLFAGTLLYLVKFPKEKVMLFLAFGLAVLLILLDVNRLQVWMYQWTITLMLIAFVRKGKTCYSLLQFMLIAMYLWSGLHKLNLAYIDHSFPYLMTAFPATEVLGQNASLAVFTGIAEAGIGAGLLFSHTRTMALLSAIVMHCIILLILGPLGLKDNSVIWPWNVAMILLLPLLFYRSDFIGIKSLWNGNGMAKVIILLWGVCPLTNIFGYWDEQLSFKMYSGSNPEGMLLMKTVEENCFPDALNIYYNRDSNEGEMAVILVDDWALLEMNVPPYMSERTLKQIGKEWCSCLKQPEAAAVELFRIQRWSRVALPSLKYSCSDLLK